MTTPPSLPTLASLARNPVPSGAIVGYFAGKDGVRLRYARWDATRGPRRGTACVFPGRGEPIEKYFETIADLRRRGFAVAIHDWRGQGGSQRILPNPRKGHIATFADYDADVFRFMKDVVLPDCPPPFIALGHSMGGNILLRQATVPGLWFDRLVLSAPMLDIARDRLPVPNRLARNIAAIAGLGPLSRAYVPGGSDRPLELCDFEGNPFTSDRERFERTRQLVEQRPELALGSPTIGWLRAAWRSCSRLMAPEFAQSVRIPMLLVAAGQDRIVSSSAIESFASRLKIGARVALAGSSHELLQERDEIRQRFWAAFDAYLGTRSLTA
ncbi:MAG: alpha/beta hydrolase [Hyphomicrobiaceae bacterium]|nr:alpha/beta hydrolase [Hyphomicrobiaceae bacterium]